MKKGHEEKEYKKSYFNKYHTLITYLISFRIGNNYSQNKTEVKPFNLSYEESGPKEDPKPAMIVKVNYAPGKKRRRSNLLLRKIWQNPAV